MFNEVKSALTSKTIWGALIAGAGAVLNMLGFDSGSLQGLDGDILTIVGAAFAAYGRIVAVKKIG